MYVYSTQNIGLRCRGDGGGKFHCFMFPIMSDRQYRCVEEDTVYLLNCSIIRTITVLLPRIWRCTLLTMGGEAPEAC